MSERVRNYTTANIPLDFAARIKKHLRPLGYQNVSEFVRDAVRRRLEEIEREAEGP